MAAVPQDPWSVGLMALGSVAKAATGAPTSSGASNQSTTVFDNSGWAVSIGGGTASSSKTETPTPAKALGAVAAGVGGLLSSPITVIAIGVALFLYLKHK